MRSPIIQHHALTQLFTSAAFLCLLSLTSLRAEEKCPDATIAVTEPAPVQLPELLPAVTALKTSDGKPASRETEKLLSHVRETFDLSKVKTKMEQFYRLLHNLAQHLSPGLGQKVSLDPKDVQKILLAASVFTDASVPNQIVSVLIDRWDPTEPRYVVEFKDEATKVPLNEGQGFYAWEGGLCQHSQALIFSKKFGFKLRKKRNHNLFVNAFTGVDLYGVFGTRGMFSVDLNYISVESVEFFSGTKNGKIVAKVSREEFKRNDHNALLQLITKFVDNSSVQPIDW